jgi:hypothetical protein
MYVPAGGSYNSYSTKTALTFVMANILSKKAFMSLSAWLCDMNICATPSPFEHYRV